MDRKRKTEQDAAVLVNVNFRAAPSLVDDYKRVVEQDERTLSQSLRLHMAQTVADARANGVLEAA